MPSQGTVAKYLNEGRDAVSHERSLRLARLRKEGLCSLGFLLEAWIRNDATTFNTPHFAGLVFFLRDAVGEEAAVPAGTARAQWYGLWGLS